MHKGTKAKHCDGTNKAQILKTRHIAANQELGILPELEERSICNISLLCGDEEGDQNLATNVSFRDSAPLITRPTT